MRVTNAFSLALTADSLGVILLHLQADLPSSCPLHPFVCLGSRLQSWLAQLPLPTNAWLLHDASHYCLSPSQLAYF